VRRGNLLRIVAACCTTAALAACQDSQSVFAAQGLEAARIAVLGWVLIIGSVVILAGVIALFAVAMYGNTGWRTRLSREAVVVVGGIVFPVATLSALLVYGLLVMRPGGAAAEAEEPLRISVIGEQWWWRVIYEGPDGATFESANEIRIPTGRRVELALATADVIHSFWVPNLAGKLDMIPGRTNVLTIEADEPGVSRGQCAEYCGGAHALMSFHVVAMEPDAFEAWLAHEAGPAEPPKGDREEQGQLLVLSSGCGGCHTIRGTKARGTIGPDLTHVGGRGSLAAGTLPNNAEAMAAWIVENQHIKPENKMPPFGIYSDSDLSALAEYLANLR
jgi:cytochrome c oxidase subunit 2